MVPIEHVAPASNQLHADAQAEARRFCKEQGIDDFYEVGKGGICHTLFIEKGYALPGELVAACDSHTCTYGALNVAARGLGVDDMTYLLATGKCWFRVPETIRFILEGTLPEWSSPKDIVLYIGGKYGADVALYKSIEYTGPGAHDLSIWGRVTICNMGIDLGAKFSLFEFDDKTEEFLKGRARTSYNPVYADSDAHYEEEHIIDLSTLGPQVTCPYSLNNTKPVEEVVGIPIQQSFIGSCNNGSIEDLRIAASLLKGRKVHERTRLVVIPGSWEVYRQAMDEGILTTFLDAGAAIEGPTCGPCNGSSKGLLGPGERCISTTNRNNKGRQGNKTSETYLSSPAVAAASAVMGCIADPRIIGKGR
ncbi:MAG: 3-isopropylmalate dehydratase large subunit, partial [Sphaerochaetaceae bacterium]